MGMNKMKIKALLFLWVSVGIVVVSVVAGVGISSRS